jgi:hypothetical protein
MAAAYLVTLPSEGGQTLRHNINGVVVYAEDATQAKEAAAALFGGDSAWSGSTATAIAAPSNYSGWTLRLRLQAPGALPGVYAIDVSVLGDATNDTIDELAALAVTALNATVINAAAYNTTTQVLTVAGAADNLGNHLLTAEFTHPDFELPVASLVSSKVDGGVVAADVTVTLRADAIIPPKVYGKATMR